MQLSFSSFHFRDKTTRTDKFLSEVDKVIPWDIILSELSSWKQAETGRKGFTPENLFRMWLLQNWYGLSDEGIEDEIYDKLSFQKFMQIDLGQPIPDSTTLCRFRDWMNEKGVQEELFEKMNKRLEEKGIIIKKGTIEDATIISAPKNKKNREKKWLDEEASSTKKNDQWYRGYKLHTGVDVGSNVIRKAKVTTAKVADSKCFDDLLSGDEKSIFADKAYCQQERKRKLREKGIFCGILDKAGPNRKLSSSQNKRNKKLSSIRAFGEHQFNVLKNRFHYQKVRYVGLFKNTAHMMGLCFLHNLTITRKHPLILQG